MRFTVEVLLQQHLTLALHAKRKSLFFFWWEQQKITAPDSALLCVLR